LGVAASTPMLKGLAHRPLGWMPQAYNISNSNFGFPLDS
jgi:hypothetical protein